jgi:hypothetical protein
MAKKTKEPKTVRYQVLKPVFVNGSLIDPKEHPYVLAAPGLEGRALRLAPEGEPSGAQSSGEETAGSGTGSPL